MKKWQLITIDQAEALKALGLNQDSAFSWFGDKDHFPEAGDHWIWTATTVPFNTQDEDYRRENQPPVIAAAYTLSEIAIMLSYSFVPSNVKEAAEKLINELKIGSTTVKDCNARLKDAQDV